MEIKFRAWHKINKLMYWFDVLWGNHRRGDGYIGMVPFGEVLTNKIYRDNAILIDPANCEFMQCSDLPDMKGNELYAKDIIQFLYPDRIEENGIGICRGVIEFENGCFVVKQVGFEYKDEKPETLYQWLVDEECEKVGNVFDNPELLKK